MLKKQETLDTSQLSQEAKMKEAIFKIKNVYGNDLVYPVNTEAMLFAKLINKKTLNGFELKTISSLGFNVTVN